jgi:hypothetical protein
MCGNSRVVIATCSLVHVDDLVTESCSKLAKYMYMYITKRFQRCLVLVIDDQAHAWSIFC